MEASLQLDQQLQDALEQRQKVGQVRTRQALHIVDSTHLELDGRRYINFASNDYLGLSHHTAVIEAIANAARQSGVGSGAAGLITGYQLEHQQCENAIAQLKGTEAAVLLPSGYQANLAAVQTLQAAGARFLIDKLAHASLIDALCAGDSQFRVFPHNHVEKLERLLSTADPQQLQIVITESIFSMDGDAADLEGLARLKKKYKFVLLLDEAHGTGVYGKNGSGYAAERGHSALADVSIITLSKAIGLSGGAVCGSSKFIQALINFGRAWIYSTMMPPMIAAGVTRAIAVIGEEPARQHRLRELALRTRAQLATAGLNVSAGDSPIIPVIFGDEQTAMAASNQLRDHGLFTVAVRPPTVPKGTSRLRLTLSSQHTDQEVAKLVETVAIVANPRL